MQATLHLLAFASNFSFLESNFLPGMAETIKVRMTKIPLPNRVQKVFVKCSAWGNNIVAPWA
jgi:hypothetical protein